MVEKTEEKGSTKKKRAKRNGPIPFATRGFDDGKCGNDGMAGLAYVLGVIGAIAYYASTASSFWMGVLGILKALVWPAFLVFELMRMLGM